MGPPNFLVKRTRAYIYRAFGDSSCPVFTAKDAPAPDVTKRQLFLGEKDSEVATHHQLPFTFSRPRACVSSYAKWTTLGSV